MTAACEARCGKVEECDPGNQSFALCVNNCVMGVTGETGICIEAVIDFAWCIGGLSCPEFEEFSAAVPGQLAEYPCQSEVDTGLLVCD